MSKSCMPAFAAALFICAVGFGLVGCFHIDAPDEINVGSKAGREPIDTSRVPRTRSHEEAREKLGQAYQRIEYLESKVRDLKEDKEELKEEREEYKRKYKRAKDRYDD